MTTEATLQNILSDIEKGDVGPVLELANVLRLTAQTWSEFGGVAQDRNAGTTLARLNLDAGEHAQDKLRAVIRQAIEDSGVKRTNDDE